MLRPATPAVISGIRCLNVANALGSAVIFTASPVRRRKQQPKNLRPFLVVITCLQYHNIVTIYQVDEPMFFIYATGPCSLEGEAQRLGFSNSADRITKNIPY